MPIASYKQGDVICVGGDPLTHLSFITNGTVEAIFGGRAFRYEKGDVIGFCGVAAGVYSFTFTAVTAVTILSYPYENIGILEKLLRDNADVAFRLVESIDRQINEFLRFGAELKHESAVVYALIKEAARQYEDLCAQYGAEPRSVLGLSGVAPYSGPVFLEDWLINYYDGIVKLSPAIRKGMFYAQPGVSTGFARRGAEDILHALRACGAYQEYLKNTVKLLLGADGQDLFSLIAELHINTVNVAGADEDAETLAMKIAQTLSGVTSVNQDYFQQRLNAYKNELVIKRASGGSEGGGAEGGAAGSGGAIKKGAPDSVKTILDYSGCDVETREKFTRFMKEYAGLGNRSGADDAERRVRTALTETFNSIYKLTFVKYLNDPEPPDLIKMFLNFGFVDAALAGRENADYLYSIAGIKGDPDAGVYTLAEWLTAIYEGKKEPNRNEFDMDYSETVAKLKATKKIDAKEETRLMGDREAKLKFELDNVFPPVNKITFGNINTFCPLFSDHNVRRKLDSTLVTPAQLKEALDAILSLDYSAFYRETAYTNPDLGIPKESVSAEVMPDFILMPNVGIRGVMWQEIEGKKRTTPARMFMPLFLENDLKILMIRLTGEFRWEMCRRVQGVRWNDLSDPSLTSEYCDYLQFFNKNQELPQAVKDAIRQELLRAKNNYRAVFVSNYADWLMYEANSSPRLNRNVRRMMLEYCTFSAPVREKLASNPQYSELLNKLNIKRQKRAKHVASIIQKVTRAGKPVPQELLDEMEFIRK